ncbi:MAG: hypothetical protein CBC35_02500 [Planctomycetes bacterium TMED75]|nr:hypothetical protein [Planctomycetaceae bacterium]OUU95744.1 MAG: hypothetical protein CBC35_02500 [Planctomycetes bacterium TMED75]
MRIKFILIDVIVRTSQTSIRTLLLAVACLPLGGCDPIFDVAGAYFPAWILCLVAGLLVTMAIRELLLRAGIDQHLFWKPIAYTGCFLTVACWVWLFFFST